VRSSGSVYRRCGCRSVETGRQLGRECLRLEDAGHGSWCFAVDVPRYPDGCSRPRVRRGGYSDRDSAVAALQELRSPVSRFDAPSTVSTGGWLRTWLGSRVSLATATATAYGFHIRLHLELALGRIPLKELRGGHVQEMFTRLAKGSKRRRPLSPSTLERIRVTLRVAMNAAIREGLRTQPRAVSRDAQTAQGASGDLDRGADRALAAHR